MKKIRTPVSILRDANRWRITTTNVVQLLLEDERWQDRFLIAASTVPGGEAGMGLMAARDYAANEDLTVYMGEDVGDSKIMPTVDTLAGQSEYLMAVNGRLIDGRYGASGAQYINTSWGGDVTLNARFKQSGTITATTAIREGDELFMSYGKQHRVGVAAAAAWRIANPIAAARLSEEERARAIRLQIPRVRV